MIPQNNNSALTNLAQPSSVSRRTLVKGAAWSVPVVAAGIAVPALAATGDPEEVSGYVLQGSCGLLGVLGPGFQLTVGTDELPSGTAVRISSNGALGLDVLDVQGALADLDVLSGSSALVTFPGGVPAAGSVQLRILLSVSLLRTFTAELILPSGYVGTGDGNGGFSIGVPLVGCRVNS